MNDPNQLVGLMGRGVSLRPYISLGLATPTNTSLTFLPNMSALNESSEVHSPDDAQILTPPSGASLPTSSIIVTSLKTFTPLLEDLPGSLTPEELTLGPLVIKHPDSASAFTDPQSSILTPKEHTQGLFTVRLPSSASINPILMPHELGLMASHLHFPFTYSQIFMLTPDRLVITTSHLHFPFTYPQTSMLTPQGHVFALEQENLSSFTTSLDKPS
jgi:hypothetical protein